MGVLTSRSMKTEIIQAKNPDRKNSRIYDRKFKKKMLMIRKHGNSLEDATMSAVKNSKVSRFNKK